MCRSRHQRHGEGGIVRSLGQKASRTLIKATVASPMNAFVDQTGIIAQGCGYALDRGIDPGHVADQPDAGLGQQGVAAIDQRKHPLRLINLAAPQQPVQPLAMIIGAQIRLGDCKECLLLAASEGQPGPCLPGDIAGAILSACLGKGRNQARCPFGRVRGLVAEPVDDGLGIPCQGKHGLHPRAQTAQTRPGGMLIDEGGEGLVIGTFARIA